MIFYLTPIPLSLILLVILLWKPMQKSEEISQKAYDSANDKVAYTNKLFRTELIIYGALFAIIALYVLFSLLSNVDYSRTAGETAFIFMVCLAILSPPFILMWLVANYCHKANLQKAVADQIAAKQNSAGK